jgi:hypothetical protein
VQHSPSIAWIDTNTSGGPIGGFWRTPIHTFFCNPSTHATPLGSCYVLLDPAMAPEKCPLLRPMKVKNSGWDPVWDDSNSVAKSSMDISVWRPQLDGAFVRFGDLIVQGHDKPTSLGVVAKDHPAFIRPRGFNLITKIYRGLRGRKCYVWEPMTGDSDYVALGYVVSATKTEPPLVDSVRCVHRDALIPLGLLRQMVRRGMQSEGKQRRYDSIEFSRGMIAFLTNVHRSSSLVSSHPQHHNGTYARTLAHTRTQRMHPFLS